MPGIDRPWAGAFSGHRVYLATHQAVGPHLSQRPGPPQQTNLALAAAAPQVDQPTPRPLLQLQLPGGGERPPRGGGLQPGRAVAAQRLHLTPGALLQAGQVWVLEARPDPRPPPAVVALDQGLKAGL